jgi:DNA processing protein
MSRTLLSLAGFQVILSGRFWVIAEEISAGNRKLIEAGGQEFPSNSWPNLSQLFENSPRSALLFSKRGQSNIGASAGSSVEQPSEIPASLESDFMSATSGVAVDSNGSDVYSHIREIILDVVTEPLDEDSVAEKLNVLPSQAKAWLKRAVEEGKVQKLKNPVRYVRTSNPLSLFANQPKAARTKRS